jgi:hypothetical protein
LLSDWPRTFRRLVGIDHGFSFPLRYFEERGVKLDWLTFLDDFQHHWPTDEQGIWVRDVRNGFVGNGAKRTGDRDWRRLVECRVRSAKSVFRFGVIGEVATSTHAGIPWLRFIRKRLGKGVHFWPFDGWVIPAGHSAVAEVYPALWRKLVGVAGFHLNLRPPRHDQGNAFRSTAHTRCKRRRPFALA